MYGVETFNDFQENPGISRNILNQRLKRLVEMEIFVTEVREWRFWPSGRVAVQTGDSL